MKKLKNYITESNLRRIIQEEAMLLEVGAGSTLYHRSKNDLEVGDVLTADKVPSDSHERKSEAERAFEEHRREYYPNKPSRLRSVFLSPTPKSRFNLMGDLYEVEVQGRVHAADSRLFDAYMEPWEWDMVDDKDQALECYWNPNHRWCQPLRKVNPKYIEVLAEKAVITDTPEDDTLRKGDKVRIIESPWVAVQQMSDDSTKDPEVWRDHPKIAEVTDEDKRNGFMDYYAMPKQGSVWTVSYVKQTDTAQQQNRYDPTKSRDYQKGNWAFSPFERITLKSGPVELAYSAGMGKGEMGKGYEQYIEDLQIEKV